MNAKKSLIIQMEILNTVGSFNRIKEKGKVDEETIKKTAK